MIYLDYTANTPADPAVLEAFCRAEQAFIGNANSAHGEGRRGLCSPSAGIGKTRCARGASA